MEIGPCLLGNLYTGNSELMNHLFDQSNYMALFFPLLKVLNSLHYKYKKKSHLE